MGVTERKEKEHLIRKNHMVNAAEKIFLQKGFERSTSGRYCEGS